MNKLMTFLNKLFNEPAVPQAPVYTEKQLEEMPRKIPFMKIIFDPFSLTIEHFRTFVIYALFYALILSLIAFIMKHPYVCLYGDFRAENSCGNNPYLYLLTHLITLFVASLFMVRWYKQNYQQSSLPISCLCRISKLDFKSFGLLLVFILINMLSALSFYLLIIRVPNPNWQIEMVFFTIVSVGFLIPLAAMRFYGMFTFVWSGEKVPPLLLFWKRSRGNSLRLLISLGLIFFICVFSLLAFNAHFKLVEQKNAVYISFMIEYLYNLLFLLLVTFFANHCYLQKEYLFGRDNNGRE